MSNETTKIQEIIQRRSIRKLIHFTRTKNLKSIIDNGLLPRSELEKRKIKVDYNDKTRMDKWLDASSLSISKKNSFLFSKFLERTSTNENDWIEILISPNILTDKFGECIYCYTNASNHKFEEFRKNQSYLTNSTAFENMFAYFVPRTSTNTGNKRLNHKDNETTDIQAEICVYGIIETKYFLNIEELRQKII